MSACSRAYSSYADVLMVDMLCYMHEGLEEDLEDSAESNVDGTSKRVVASRRRVSNLFWKPPKKLEFGATRRMSFEMTQASSLKAQVKEPHASSISYTEDLFNSQTSALIYAPPHCCVFDNILSGSSKQ